MLNQKKFIEIIRIIHFKNINMSTKTKRDLNFFISYELYIKKYNLFALNVIK